MRSFSGVAPVSLQRRLAASGEQLLGIRDVLIYLIIRPIAAAVLYFYRPGHAIYIR